MLAELASMAGNVISGVIGQRSADKQAKQNIELQKEFAKNGIQWKVADAQAAGIHPLAALGANTMSFAPSSVGGSPLAAGIAAGGQDLSRAINATRSTSERVDAYTKTVQDLNIQRMGLENQLLGSQIAKINQAGTPPAMPTKGDRYLIEGQGNAPLVKDIPLTRVHAAPGQPSSEAGAVTDTGFARTERGWAPVMSKDFQERAEDDVGAMISWNIRNRLGPTFGVGYNPPKDVNPGEGNGWFFNPVTQEYTPIRTRSAWPKNVTSRWRN